MAYTPGSPDGTVRLLINDVGPDEVFTDVEIGAFLTLEGQNVKRAAARALLVLAANEALLAKKIRTQDWQSDGPAVAAELRAQAVQLRAEADDDQAAGDDSWGQAIVPGSSSSCRPELTERPWSW